MLGIGTSIDWAAEIVKRAAKISQVSSRGRGVRLRSCLKQAEEAVAIGTRTIVPTCVASL